MVDKFLGRVQWSLFRFLVQKLTLNEVGNILAAASAAMGLVFGNAICNQFLRNRIPGFFQIPCDFFLLGLIRGKRRGQLPIYSIQRVMSAAISSSGSAWSRKDCSSLRISSFWAGL